MKNVVAEKCQITKKYFLHSETQTPEVFKTLHHLKRSENINLIPTPEGLQEADSMCKGIKIS